MTPLVSIITITYNAEKVLQKTIENILEQSCKNFEYIIVDGNSKDSTTNIIQRFPNHKFNSLEEAANRTEHPEGIIWISESDKGLYDAMNKGIQMAKGEFVWFINAGDKIYDKDTMQRISDVFTQNSTAEIIYGQSLIIDENDKPLGERHKIAPKVLTIKSMLNGLVVCHQSILVKTSIVDLYDTQYRIAADYDWVCKAVEKSKFNCYIDQYISRFMVAGISTQQRKKAWGERFRIMKKHFGLCTTLWAHFIIAIKYPFSIKNG